MLLRCSETPFELPVQPSDQDQPRLLLGTKRRKRQTARSRRAQEADVLEIMLVSLPMEADPSLPGITSARSLDYQSRRPARQSGQANESGNMIS